ncbi:head-tail preconnector protein [Escherichia coli]|nr:head-tail preconnector protein [Escherichia coli]
MKPTRTHKARRENRSADQLSKYGAVSLREQARFLDINHDLVIGVFDKLEERVIGAKGIVVEPQPLLKNGDIATELAMILRRLWVEWSVSPDVTGQYTRPMLERLLLRTWLRDGEVFAQLVRGAGGGWCGLLACLSGSRQWSRILCPCSVMNLWVESGCFSG